MTNEEKLDLLIRAVRDIHIFTTPGDGFKVQDLLYAAMNEAAAREDPHALPIDGLVEDVVMEYTDWLIGQVGTLIAKEKLDKWAKEYLATKGKEDVIPK